MKFSVLLFVLVCCAYGAEGEPLAPGLTFRFGGGERIKLLVMPDPGNAGIEQIVSDDGYIALPVGEPVNIKNKTLFEAHKLINAQIEKSSGVRKISASIALLSVPARTVYVGGEGIKSSMSVPLPGVAPLTLYAAILAAGGVTAEGDPSRVTVTRSHADGRVTSETYDVSGIGNPGAKTLGPVLEAGDVIKVARGDVFILAGEVLKPGALNKRDSALLGGGGNVRVSSAIYATGGLRPGANRKSVKVLRTTKDGKRVVLNVDLDAPENPGKSAPSDTPDPDPLLLDGDIVLVGQSGGVAVLGKVRLPGVYPVGGQNIKLTRVLALAGGFAEFAKTSSITIIKASNGYGALHVDLSQIQKNGFVDPELEDGDLVFVGEKLL